MTAADAGEQVFLNVISIIKLYKEKEKYIGGRAVFITPRHRYIH